MNQTVNFLVETFRWMANSEADPEAAIRSRLREFRSFYLTQKGMDGGYLEEGEKWLVEAIRRDPASWPVSDTHLKRIRELWEQVFFAPDRLPDLKPAAQAVWLGIEVHCSNDIIDGALSKLFPAATPIDFAEAYREAFV